MALNDHLSIDPVSLSHTRTTFSNIQATTSVGSSQQIPVRLISKVDISQYEKPRALFFFTFGVGFTLTKIGGVVLFITFCKCINEKSKRDAGKVHTMKGKLR